MSATSLPLVPALRPRWTATVPRQLVVVALATVALTVSSKLSVPLWPVPVTAQTLVVLLLGFALGPRLAGASVVAWLAQAAVGLPVLSGPTAGPAVLAGPTGGYLAGFVLAAVLTGVLAEHGWQQRWWTVAAGMVLGNLVIYATGASWLASLTDWSTAWASGVVPFLVGDLIKIAIAVALVPVVARHAHGSDA